MIHIPNISASSVDKVHRALASMVLDMVQQGQRRDRLNHLAIDPSIAFKKVKCINLVVLMPHEFFMKHPVENTTVNNREQDFKKCLLIWRDYIFWSIIRGFRKKRTFIEFK
jgi:hypothetical protein